MNQAKWRVVLVVLVVMFFGVAESSRRSSAAPGIPASGVDRLDAGGPIAGPDRRPERRCSTWGWRTSPRKRTSTTALGPRFNFVGCAGCHVQPAVGGTSPAVNPLFRVDAAEISGSGNVIPSFITRGRPDPRSAVPVQPDGSRDGGVHALFVITGHPDAARLQHPAGGLRDAGPQQQHHLPDSHADLRRRADRADPGQRDPRQPERRTRPPRAALGISGRPNRNGNDGTITRFGWKAQNKSLLIFSGEAYNVEMGITNEGFQQERDETAELPVRHGSQRRDTRACARSAPSRTSPTSSASWRRRRRRPTTPGGAISIDRGRQQFTERRLRPLPHADAQDQRNTTVVRPGQQDGESVLRPGAARHGAGARRRHPPGRGPGRRVPDRAAVGPRQAHLLPPRRPHGRPRSTAIQAHRSDGNSKFGAVGGQCRDRQVTTASSEGEQAGPAQLPALARSLSSVGPGRGEHRRAPAAFRDPVGGELGRLRAPARARAGSSPTARDHAHRTSWPRSGRAACGAWPATPA